jgi:thiamine-phosphate pyrophosphorylase
VRRPAPRVTLITATDVVAEAELCRRLERVAELDPAARARLAVQLRSPELSSCALHRLGERLRRVTARLGVGLIVNDRLDLARALGVDGVHLGRRSVHVADARALLGADAWVSVSAHCLDDLRAARAEGADAALLSPIFASPGKASPLGLARLREARAVCAEAGALALIALGGIDARSALSCRRAGSDGVAVLRADLSEALVELLG